MRCLTASCDTPLRRAISGFVVRYRTSVVRYQASSKGDIGFSRMISGFVAISGFLVRYRLRQRYRPCVVRYRPSCVVRYRPCVVRYRPCVAISGWRVRYRTCVARYRPRGSDLTSSSLLPPLSRYVLVLQPQVLVLGVLVVVVVGPAPSCDGRQIVGDHRKRAAARGRQANNVSGEVDCTAATRQQQLRGPCACARRYSRRPHVTRAIVLLAFGVGRIAVMWKPSLRMRSTGTETVAGSHCP